MAAPLKDSFGPEVAERIAELLVAVRPDFPAADFVAAATKDFADLELADRSRAVAAALVPALPADPAVAIRLITASLPAEADAARWQGMHSFMLWPFTMYVAEHGLDCFEDSMVAQRELTKRFTSEFSIRPFIEQRYEPTMAQLARWTRHDSEHVRRLVSEGTRPRLPWASRLQRFIHDPAPILPLLEMLKDDPSEYVRRSVANNLNDIAKDHPDQTLAVAERWLTERPERRRLVRHALRTLVKAGDPQALAILGFGRDEQLRAEVALSDRTRRIGDSLVVTITVANDDDRPVDVLVDYEVRFARPGGGNAAKVFKGAEVVIPAGSSRTVRKSLTLRQLSTRTLYPGEHLVSALVNGERSGEASFRLYPATGAP